MTIGGYNIPFAGTFMPYVLGIMLIAVARVLISRIWNDKELDIKKMGFLVLAVGLGFTCILNMGDIINWIWQVVSKVIEFVINLEVPKQ